MPARAASATAGEKFGDMINLPPAAVDQAATSDDVRTVPGADQRDIAEPIGNLTLMLVEVDPVN